jgi:carbamoyl-phosphate synthase small subunit
MVGNFGVPKKKLSDRHLVDNFESERIWAKGVVVEEYADHPSHFESTKSFDQWLEEEKIPGISGIDTRYLTQKIRDHGVLPGLISNFSKRPSWRLFHLPSPVPIVSYRQRIRYRPKRSNGKHLVLIDCGVKHGILRELLINGYTITRIPYDDDPLSIRHTDGVVCSNGPGDPKDCKKTIQTIKRVVEYGMPFLGVCLGHQLLSLAIGADTYKLPFGHRGINQPCLDVTTHKAYVTSQNHGYAVKKESIPKEFDIWFTNLNDGTIEGIRHKKRNVKSTQFHPEGHPGPGDTRFIFHFI